MFDSFFDCKCGNNLLDYSQRAKLGSDLKLYIPWLEKIKFENVKEKLHIWDKIVFEVVEDGKLLSKVGLKSYLEFEKQGIKYAIFDNHNVALYFLWKNFLESGEKLDLIHIDQHSDLREPYYYPAKLDSIEEIIQYTFKGVNVGSYLLPAKRYFVNEIYQVRTQFALRNLDKDFVKGKILNIDLDFWAPGMATCLEDLHYLKSLLPYAKMVLLATSPYFLDQELAIDLILKLLEC